MEIFEFALVRPGMSFLSTAVGVNFVTNCDSYDLRQWSLAMAFLILC